jgi:hypothetical protein
MGKYWFLSLPLMLVVFAVGFGYQFNSVRNRSVR